MNFLSTIPIATFMTDSPCMSSIKAIYRDVRRSSSERLISLPCCPGIPNARSLFGLDTDGRCLATGLVVARTKLPSDFGAALGSMVGHYETCDRRLYAVDSGRRRVFPRR